MRRMNIHTTDAANIANPASEVHTGNNGSKPSTANMTPANANLLGEIRRTFSLGLGA